MELINNLALGFATALTLQNLFYCFIGAVIGTLIGVLPGIGPVATLAMLLPATYALPPLGAHHAGRNLLRRAIWRVDHGDPGQPTRRTSSVVTCIDGYQMARRAARGLR